MASLRLLSPEFLGLLQNSRLLGATWSRRCYQIKRSEGSAVRREMQIPRCARDDNPLAVSHSPLRAPLSAPFHHHINFAAFARAQQLVG